MKVTYESLPKKFEEIKQYLTPGTIDAVQATLPIWEFYGDAEFKPSIDDVIELVNNELPDDEPAPAPKPEPKAEEKPKAEPKPKKEPKPKAEKQPKPKFKKGDKVHCAIYDNDEDNKTVVFEILYANSFENGEWVYYVTGDGQHYVKESKITKAKAEKPKKEPKPKAEKQPKEKKAKEKAEPEGEPMAKVSPEITIIKRFVKFGHSKKAKVDSARLILVALQKMIVNKEIRKTSQYADDIMDIQKALLSIVKNGKVEFDRSKFERYEKLADTEYQEPIAKLSRSFIGLIGKVGVKDKAKNLLEKFEKAEVSGDLVDTMKKALKAYIEGKTTTVETEERSLQGIYGLAGI